MFDPDHHSYLKNYGYKVQNGEEYGERKDTKLLPTYEDVEVSDSQNFCLRLSAGTSIPDSEVTNENEEKNGQNDIIILSDSSFTSNPGYSSEQRSESANNFTKKKVYVLDSTESECSDSEDEKFFQAWKANKMHEEIKDKKQTAYNNTMKKKNTFYTSDESSSSTRESNDAYIQNSSDKTNSTHISPTPQTTDHSIKNVNKTPVEPQSKAADKLHLSSSQNSSSGGTTSSSRANRALISNDNRGKSTGAELTRQDKRNILRNIKATKAVYDSPATQKENTIINETLDDDDDVHPAISYNSNLKMKNAFFEETPPHSENGANEVSKFNSIILEKNHLTRFLGAPDVENTSTELSERKKKQISQWLLSNSPDSKSDSSFSNVPPSNRSSISSGNSSLERLEMNYETPNNRGRMPKPHATDQRITLQNCDRIIPSTTPRQSTIHEFIEKSKDNTLVLRTPKTHKKNENQSLPSTANTPPNIMDCADILDKLYGNVWRAQADALLPVSEPRNKVIPTKNRAVQTERKVTKHKNHYTIDSESDSGSSPRKLKSQLHRANTKRTVQKSTKKRDSFINDDWSSESGCESLYYTALTNPRVSVNTDVAKPTRLPASAQRVIAICDSDTDVEDNKKDRNDHATDIRRRKLSFSNDEDERGSSTSEFDPGDNVPPKSVSKKATKKTSRQKLKEESKTLNTKSSSLPLNKQKHFAAHRGHTSFLASLSESVPIGNAHPDAKKYRTDFKNSKDSLCKYLFKLYNEEVFDKKLPEDMSLEWNVRMRGTAGFCYNKKSLKALGGIVKSSRIVLSTKVLDTPDRLRDTLIHEMCHAAAWLINDVSDGHGPFWTGWANKAMKTFPELPQIRRCHDYKIKTKFTYKCTGCGYSIGRHSKSLDVEKKRCGHCYGKFELLINKTTKSGTVQMQTPKREPSAFALYVKDNYSTVKKDRNIKHAEVMKVLGQQFSAIKIAKQSENVCNDSESPG